MKRKLTCSLLALLMSFSSTVTLLSTEVLANDTVNNTIVINSTITEATYEASGNITFTGTEGKFKDGTKPCCIGCFSKYIVAVAQDGTEHTLSLTKTDTWEATWDATGLPNGNYTFRITEEYDYYYAYSVSGSFTVNGNNVTDINLYIVDQTSTASGAITFIGTEGKFKDGTKPCCIGCFGEFIVVTDSNGNQQKAHFTKTDTWEGAWIVGDLQYGNYSLSISDEYEFSDYYEIKDGSFTIENQESLIGLSVFIIDSSDVNLNQNVITTLDTTVTNETVTLDTIVTNETVTLDTTVTNETVTLDTTVTNETVTSNVSVDNSSEVQTVVPSTMAKLLNQLF